MFRISVLAVLVALTGCGESHYERFKTNYDQGYQRGYAEAYVNDCKGGKFVSSKGIGEDAYSNGYLDGHQQGKHECDFEVEG